MEQHESDNPSADAQSQNPGARLPIAPKKHREQDPKSSSEPQYEREKPKGPLLKSWLKFCEHQSDRIIELIIALAVMFVTGGQWITACRNNISTSRQTERIIIAADRINDAADSFSGSSEHINEGIGDAVGQLQNQVAAVTGQTRVDQRAWLDIENGDPIQLAQGQPIVSSVKILNIGKTVALKISGTMKVELLALDQPPDFVYGSGHHYCFGNTGFLFPGELNTPALPCDAWEPGSKSLQAHLLTDIDQAKYSSGKFFVATHGHIEYYDAFGVHHWITFCRMSFPNGQIMHLGSHRGTDACEEIKKQTQTLNNRHNE